MKQQNFLDYGWMTEWSNWSGASTNSFGLFRSALHSFCDEEQQIWWLSKASNFEITGCYAQTELGHGSNVQGLQTLAFYDYNNQEFILNTPTIEAIKWWPGALGVFSTHAIVFAKLILNEQDKGINAFMVQIRDENHKQLPGIEVGDIGAKLGDNLCDSGYLILHNVRIPRRHMLGRIQYVNEKGQLVTNSKFDKKEIYSAMLISRAHLIYFSYAKLAKAVTIASRYSCIRKQGFIQNSKEENQIINYQVQQYRIIKQIAISFALKALAMEIYEIANGFLTTGKFQSKDLKMEIKEFATICSGLKAYSTMIAFSGAEDCRQSCGGNGYLLHSGLPQLVADCQLFITAEGDYTVLNLFVSKEILKALQLQNNQFDNGSPFWYLNKLQLKEYVDKLDSYLQLQSKNALLDISYLIEVFIFRFLKLVKTCQSKIKNELQFSQMSLQQAANNNALLMVKLAESHSKLYTLLSFQRRIDFVKTHNELDSSENEKITIVLDQLCIVYGLTNIVDDDWNGILHPHFFDQANEMLLLILQDLRSQIIPLTDSFDFPDFALNSSIGNYKGEVYQSLLKAARNSELNLPSNQPFYGYKELLAPLLNKDFLKLKNQEIPNSSL